MTTALLTHPASHGHVTPPGHPERVDRLHAVLKALDADEFSALRRVGAPQAKLEDIADAHSQDYVQRIRDAAESAGDAITPLDADTSITAGSWDAALRAAGALTAAVDLVMGGEVTNAFCASRPPGHHAEQETAMGFCIFNNVAVGACHARKQHNLARVAVVDFDVHHGNGTQAIFEANPDVLFLSSHQMPLYPGTGSENETGVGNIVNMPLPPGAGSESFRAAWRTRGLVELERFAPEMIFISAGFDGHEADPLANMRLTEDDYCWITRKICQIATRICDGRVVSTLEGGYDLDALAASVRVHVLALMS